MEVRERFDPFLGTSKERVARKFGVVGVNVHAARSATGQGPAQRAPSGDSQ